MFTALTASSALWWLAASRPASTSGPLRQEAYVWQRNWTPAVDEAVGEHGRRFAALPVLAAEVVFAEGRPKLTRVAVDFGALRKTGVDAYPVIRIGQYAGSFQAGAPATAYLIQLTRGLLAEWSKNEIEPREVQFDFDCPTSKLAGYRSWVQTLKNIAAPVPVTITALPTWLTSRDFKALARAADGFVLQVHSFQAPGTASDPYILCDPAAAIAYVERAAKVGVPFRVALPTYGYRLIFDERGKLKGLAAEGTGGAWPEHDRARVVKANPIELAGLVQRWTGQRPELLRGLIWYRLPNRDDELNWPWETLTTVMAGQVPEGRLAFHSQVNSGGLVELTVTNAGTSATSFPEQLELSWSKGRLVAGDGLGGFELEETAVNGARLRRIRNGGSVEPGGRITVGWLRLSANTEVRIE